MKTKTSISLFIMTILLSSGVIVLFIDLAVADGPDNATIGKITWAASRDSNWEIYTMNEDGTTFRRLTFDPPVFGAEDQHPVFTPDGSKIVWARSMNIWIMNQNGTGKTQLTTTGLDNHPFVANVPGIGLRIYFNRINTTNQARTIWSMNLDSSNPQQLTDINVSRWHPIVRESDGLIVYAVDTDFDRIGEYAATYNQTSGVETIIYNPGWNVSAPAWKPDGSKIVLAEDAPDDTFGIDLTKYSIATINPDGTGRTKLTNGSLHDTTPYYRYPTGDKIVFNRDVPDPLHRDVFIMNADGSGQTNLTFGQPGGAGSADTFVVEKSSCGPVPPQHPEIHDPFPSYVTIEAYCNTEGAHVSVSITMDGNLTGFNTTHTFTGLFGTHHFTVPSNDPSGHPFKQWSTGETSTTLTVYLNLTVYSNTTYTAYYETPVGGVWVSVDKFGLLVPYLALASAILVATAATAIYVKRVKRRKKKQ